MIELIQEHKRTNRFKNYLNNKVDQNGKSYTNVDIICIFLEICLREIGKIVKLTILIFGYFVGTPESKTSNLDYLKAILCFWIIS